MHQPLSFHKTASRQVVFIVALIGLCGASRVASAQVRAYVTNFGSDNGSVIDTSSNTVVAAVAVGSSGSQPQGVAITPDGTRAYVADCGGAVFVLDTSTNKVAIKIVVGAAQPVWP